MRPELQLILASAPLHTSPPAPLPNEREAREAELQAIDALIPDIQDWNYFTTQLIDRGLAPLLYKKLPHLANSQVIPTHVQSKLRSAYYKTVSRSMMLYGALHEVVQEFNKEGITVIALKGIFLSEHLYLDIGLRLMSDIDLLVKEKDGERCLQILERLGYNSMPYSKNISVFIDDVHHDATDESGQAHYRPMLKGEVSVEIHTKLQNTSEHYQQSLSDIWENAKPVSINGLPALALDNYNLLIHLCLHLHKHNVVLEHVQFTSFADITNILSEIERTKSKEQRREEESKDVETQSIAAVHGKMGLESFVWEKFIAKCKVYKCEEPVFKYLLLCREYFNAPLSDYLYEAYKQTFTDQDLDLFQKHLTGYDFAAARNNSAVPVHFRNIKHIKNPLLKLRYVVEVLFPPKAFMVEKYLNQFTIHNAQCIIKEQESETSASTLTKMKTGKKLCILNYELCIKFWWLWYGYRWWVALRAVLGLRR